MSASELEDTFAMQLDAVGLDGYVREYQAIPAASFVTILRSFPENGKAKTS